MAPKVAFGPFWDVWEEKGVRVFLMQAWGEALLAFHFS